MIPERLYQSAEALGRQFCDWPNEAISGRRSAQVLLSAEARRAAWEALQPRRASSPPGPGQKSNVFADSFKNSNVFRARSPQRARRGRPPKERSQEPEILPSGMPLPSSVGWRTTAGAERLLPGNVVFWRGPSLLTGEPIMAVAGQHTINAKTGPMVQIWILRSDMTPIEAVKSGGDEAICGDCKLRRKIASLRRQ